ncbi:MAG: hypothetical protein V5B35_14600 [Candidatus Accumulibacter necessarius]|jgi:hypothetical protein|uniref:hypothetical protein n=1 Tax=Candidatus Accumulibacter necessarius TaxID=2954386 RepID=UPI002FC3B252
MAAYSAKVIRLGQTTGREKAEAHHQALLPIQALWVHLRNRYFRRVNRGRPYRSEANPSACPPEPLEELPTCWVTSSSMGAAGTSHHLPLNAVRHLY